MGRRGPGRVLEGLYFGGYRQLCSCSLPRARLPVFLLKCCPMIFALPLLRFAEVPRTCFGYPVLRPRAFPHLPSRFLDSLGDIPGFLPPRSQTKTLASPQKDPWPAKCNFLLLFHQSTCNTGPCTQQQNCPQNATVSSSTRGRLAREHCFPILRGMHTHDTIPRRICPCEATALYTNLSAQVAQVALCHYASCLLQFALCTLL